MGILDSLVAKYNQAKLKANNKKVFKEALLEAVKDGQLSQEEIAEIEKKKAELSLSDEEIKKIKVDAYLAAFSATKADAMVTKNEEIELENIQSALGIEDSQISRSKTELARLRLINEIQNGNIPDIQVTNLILAKNEKVYWVEPASLIEEKVIRRTYQGGSQGMSFRVMKGVSYRVGGSRGHIESQTGMVVVSVGDLIITNMRVIFRGNQKSCAAKYDKILDTQLFSNAFQFSENGKSKPRIIKFAKVGNVDIIGSVLSYAINHYGETIERKS